MFPFPFLLRLQEATSSFSHQKTAARTARAAGRAEAAFWIKWSDMWVSVQILVGFCVFVKGWIFFINLFLELNREWKKITSRKWFWWSNWFRVVACFSLCIVCFYVQFPLWISHWVILSISQFHVLKLVKNHSYI